MLAHQVGGMVRACPECRHDVGMFRRVAQSHGDVAQPLDIADAIDGTARQLGVEVRLFPGKQFQQ